MAVLEEHGVETHGQLTDSIRIPKALFHEAAMILQKDASAA